MKKQLLLVAIIVATTITSYAQYIGLEGSVPANWNATNSNLNMSGTHYKLGSQSVKWEWNQGGEILITNPQNINTALNTYKGGMMLWIYNETPIDEDIIVEFGNGSTVSYWFNYNINFKGWRACWLRFKEDMKGTKGVTSLDYMRIKAPSKVASGKLFFDRMMFPSERINDRVTPDAQLPYINPEMNTNHWGALYYWENKTTSDIPLKNALTTDEMNQLKTFTSNVYQSLKPTISTTQVNNAKKFYNNLNIQINNGVITGDPYVSNDEAAINSGGGDATMKKINNNLYLLAKAAKLNNDQDALDKYINMMKYVIDQGFAVNSGMGTNHHYGYNFAGFCESILLLKDELDARGLLESFSKVGTYWAGIQEYKEQPHNDDLQGVIDSWNTVTIPRLTSIATKPNDPEKYRNLIELKRWMDESLKYSNGTIGGIKADGSTYHHGALYPAYANGGYTGLGKYINLTRNTDFNLSNESKKHIWEGIKALLTFTQERYWGIGVSGRHPLSSNGKFSNGVVRTMGTLANTEDPYTGAPFWREVGEQYLRFETANTTNKKNLINHGVAVGTPYEGAFTYNYSAFGVYRKDNWLVSIKGYNKYSWGAEIYKDENRYGRYQSYGTVQVLTGDKATNANNGFEEEGWDWNRAPGATSVHLPLDQLESPNSGSLSVVGEMAFTGYANLENQYGLFGMLLREENQTNFVPTHQADKSVFAFDRYIVCSGTNISNDNNSYRTETTLFQYKLSAQNQAIVVDGNTITSFPYSADFADGQAHWIIDINNNGFWIPAGSSIEIRKQTQNSKSSTTKAATTGDFAVAVINHGNAPKGQEYQYVILPNTTIAEMQNFSNTMASANKAFELEQTSTSYHIYNAPKEQVKGYCFYNASSINDELISETDRACLILTKKISSSIVKVSYTDPDLRIQLNERITPNPSTMGDGLVTLKGSYQFVGDHDNCVIVSQDANQTVLRFSTQHGIKNEVTLEKKENPILISESFENAPSASTYLLSDSYDTDNKVYFNRYELASMNKYYANSARISGTDQNYILAGAKIQNAQSDAVSVNFATVNSSKQIKALHCSFLLGTLNQPADKFENTDFVRLEYKNKNGIYSPIGQLVGTQGSKDPANPNPNFGKLGSDRDLNSIIDADITTEYSSANTAQKFEFEIHNIDISDLDFRILLKTDHYYEGIHIDMVEVKQMPEWLQVRDITRNQFILSADINSTESGTIHYLFSPNEVPNITTKYILNSTTGTKGSEAITKGATKTVSKNKTVSENYFLYLFLESADGTRSDIVEVKSSITASTSPIGEKQITVYKGYEQLNIEGLNSHRKYNVAIYSAEGNQLFSQNYQNESHVEIQNIDLLPSFIIVQINDGKNSFSYKIFNK